MIKFSTLTGSCRRFIVTALTALFGTWHWQQPGWLSALARHLRSTVGFLRARPLKSVLGLLAALLVFAAGWGGYQWWQTRPQPVTADFTVTAPQRTEIENDAVPHPLVVTFDASVAPMVLADKDVPQGIAAEPAIAGKWHWVGDRRLEFRPDKDWPVGQEYKLTIDANLVARQIKLKRYEFSFASPAFTAALDNAEFYQDPLDPALKKAVIHLRFSHPVDGRTLEKRISLKLKNKTQAAEDAAALKFTVHYDKLKLNAFVHSQTLPIPRHEQQVLFALGAGVRAEGSKAGGNAPLTAEIEVPGLYNNRIIDAVQLTVAPNTQTQQQDQILIVTTTVPVHEQETAKALSVWLLPQYHPGTPEAERQEPYPWAADEATPDILKLSTRLALQAVPSEREFGEMHSFRLDADVGRRLLVKIDKGVKSFGGYVSSEAVYRTLEMPEFPQELRIMGEGSLLALSGEKKVALLTRDLPGVKVELGRIMPGQVQHLVSQTYGDFGHPSFRCCNFGQDNMSERFELAMPLPETVHGRPYYQAVDLSRYLTDAQGQDKRGMFLLTAKSYDPAATDPPDDESEEETIEDRRLILVTDLGIVVKTELDGSQVAFVQSIRTGQPQPGAEVQVIGKNGLALFGGQTDADGKVRFAKLANMQREREPVLYLVRHQGDMSFLPLDRRDRALNFSRFNIGGIANALDANQLSAYLFSDRGIYRPGETFNIGIVVKAEQWNMLLADIPLQAEVLDARGLTVEKSTLNLGPGGFNELSYTTLETSPTGNYTVNLYTVKDGKADQQLGSTQVKVEEFQPDRMKIAARFSQPVTEGWVYPKDLQALVNVQNLYGAPAEARQVDAELTLSPALPAFKRYRDYQFHDPHYAQESYSETLNAAQTDVAGNAAFALGLEKYAGATYRLHFLARAFEAKGGRSVAADAETLVSDRPFLIGYKADGALDFVAKDAQRQVHLLAVDPQLQTAAADALTLEHLERKVLSVLTRQEDGTYRYESRRKENVLQKTPLAIAKEGFNLPLASATPGDYAYIVRDAAGLMLARIDYSVAGQGNVSRTLDRNAELQLTLDKQEYAHGETIAVNIRAPYTGSGLITVERDKVYASRWFRADTQASVQSIDVPKELEGNGYVTVQYVREPGSDEIFMSPLSYATAPFKVGLSEHTQPLTLSVPERIKPGEALTMKLHSAEPTRAVVFAVDEGILQVARYKNPDPLNYFFRKRQLQVETAQILDLILPEFKKLLAAAAPGGDGEDAAAAYLNPFKRKHDKPAVYWSGIVDIDGDKELAYRVPETFNGALRVVAVAVNAGRIGAIAQKTLVRGDLIVTPNAPATIAPGDEFSVGVAVANNIDGSGKQAQVRLELRAPPQLTVVGEAVQTLSVAEGHEAAANFRLRAAQGTGGILGNATLAFEAQSAGRAAKMHSDLSIRPASPKIATLRFGDFRGAQDVPIERRLYPEYRKVSAGISALPLVALPGLAGYLDNFAYGCTEQLVSKTIPALILGRRPEFAGNGSGDKAKDALAKLFAVLRARQNSEGGFGLWAASPQAAEFASVYAAHLLLEAREYGETAPDDMLQKGLAYLQTLASSPANDLPSLRVRAYAAYLLTRRGAVTATILAALREALDANVAAEVWHDDLTAAYLAASYQLLKQERLAGELIEPAAGRLGSYGGNYRYDYYYDPLIRDAQTLYLMARHFPERLRKMPPAFFQGIAKLLQQGHFNTLSSAYLLLAYDAYLQTATPETAGQMTITAADAEGRRQALQLPANFAPRAAFPETAVSLHFEGPGGLPLYYAVAEAGFDKQPPAAELRNGLEIARSYLNDAGKVVNKIATGEEVTVQLRLRAIDRDRIDNVAIQDLLPGGFEPVLQTPGTEEADEQDASTDEQNDTGDEGQGETAPSWDDRLSTGGEWNAEYADVREDRVVLYGSVTRDLAEYRYRIRATAAGLFAVPPVYAEAMYEPDVQAHSSEGRMIVEDAETKPNAQR
jgi:uncharacterized protein YfaS (alpha-2-macroglobulin family)